VLGYSGTPAAEEARDQKGDRPAILRQPAGFHNYLGALPDGVDDTWSGLKLVIRLKNRWLAS
jgi:hypothetical protein